MEDKKVLLSVKDLVVKFHVRGRILTAIRGISLDIYENESIAIVGESGSGKSVFTKTFAGMLDSNGFIDEGQILYNDPDLAETYVNLTGFAKSQIESARKSLDEYSKLENGAATYREIKALENEKKSRMELNEEEQEAIQEKLNDLQYERTELFNKRQTFNPKTERNLIREATQKMHDYDDQIKKLQLDKNEAIRKHTEAYKADTEFHSYYDKKMSELHEKYSKEISEPISDRQKKRNEILAKEMYLSGGRYGFFKTLKLMSGLRKAIKKAMTFGVDLDDNSEREKVFDTVAFYVKYVDETPEKLHGYAVLNIANMKESSDWNQIRGTKVATIFQDPMTSLNPIITIGKQITSIIVKHQHCSESEARIKAMQLMKKVGIPNAEHRFDDYPFQYSGGMRQRIVIAIALSCQPKILICDEPTTALDVTIQAQILQLLKELQKEFGYTIVFITHDLGVVANIAERVAVLYAGQIVEVGTVDEVFYDPHHPYTWALLSSLPQLAQRNTTLYSITGTPPSLYNKIVGDPFAPRNPYCLKIDTVKEPPMFKITDTHYAKTWLLDPRAPKVEKPEIIRDIHGTLIRAFNI
ncbi:MAG: ATP-binding cassette domain-containing protein [Firmicutes bacterium]|nr:ATP-binding cassette domain-containing protein [Bacillota bacterium]